MLRNSVRICGSLLETELPLLLGCWWSLLRSLRPQLLAGRRLVFLNDLVRNLVQYRVLVLALDPNNDSQQNASSKT